MVVQDFFFEFFSIINLMNRIGILFNNKQVVIGGESEIVWFFYVGVCIVEFFVYRVCDGGDLVLLVVVD